MSDNGLRSHRLDGLKQGIFAELTAKKEEVERSGRKIYNLFVGTPDFLPSEHIVKTLSEAAADPLNYKYTLKDMDELSVAVSKYYKKRFEADIEPDCIALVNGTQRGMPDLMMAIMDPDDLVLVPDPGYPVFEAAVRLCGAKPYYYTLKEENSFLPVLSEIPEEIAYRAKAMVVSYPYNPVCRKAPKSFYEELIAFAKKYDIFIIHDNAYSDIVFDGEKGGSFLAIDGAKDVGGEFFSLSKSFNVTGARISFFLGRKDVVSSLKLYLSQVDFGTFLPVQKAALAALTGPLDGVEKQRMLYQERRDALCQGLRNIGWNVPDSEGTMFVWAPIPEGYKTSREFVGAMLEKAGVLCTPGESFGPSGEGYVRFALVLPPDVIAEAVEAIRVSGVLNR
ncbi:MAG: aminotransferase class I/II-fold pyridoxal phosphate-dependent enzyme [Erysipelotrichaceae bacterium]|nr:aminotransferase class I/II-fold pyridoxal phosphate-dependent enzyme [Erysipelotrichaceae bacterium]